jgi:hypothetical protein
MMKRVIEITSKEDLQRKVRIKDSILNGLNFKPFKKYDIEITYNENLFNPNFGTLGVMVTNVKFVAEHCNKFVIDYNNLTHNPTGIELDCRNASFEAIREIIDKEDLSSEDVVGFLKKWIYYKRNDIRNRNSKIITDSLPRLSNDYKVGGIPILFLEEYKGKDIGCARTLKEAHINGWNMFTTGSTVVGFKLGVKTIPFVCKAESTEEVDYGFSRDADEGRVEHGSSTVTTEAYCDFPTHKWSKGSRVKINGLPDTLGSFTVDTSNGTVKIVSIKGDEVTMELVTQIVSNIL